MSRAQGTGGRRADPWLDAIAARAANRCRMPLAIIALRTPRLRRAVAVVGAPEIVGRPFDLSLCAEAAKTPSSLFVVPDAARDERFAHDPFVTGPARVRFYAGMPLRIKGEVIGTLCVMDHAERELSFFQRLTLRRLAWRAALALDVRRIEARTTGGGNLIF